MRWSRAIHLPLCTLISPCGYWGRVLGLLGLLGLRCLEEGYLGGYWGYWGYGVRVLGLLGLYVLSSPSTKLHGEYTLELEWTIKSTSPTVSSLRLSFMPSLPFCQSTAQYSVCTPQLYGHDCLLIKSGCSWH